MKAYFGVFSITLLLAACLSPPVMAWGPVTQLSVVSTAVQVLSQDGSIPLLQLDEYVWEGARISAEGRNRLFPNFGVDPIGTIEREMNLLQSMKTNRVDPYYVYRLGILGTLIAEVTAPMATASPVYRERYFADVDKNIQRAQMQPSTRKRVDPQAYFARVIREAQVRETTIEKDYESGTGFNGLARAALAQDASRSVSAVADVWFTILSSTTAFATVSKANVEQFILGGLGFYLERKKLTEAGEVHERALGLSPLRPEFRERMGDLFIAAQEFERGMDEYRAVLKIDPARRDVMKKVSEHFQRVGNDALENRRLETALEAFTSALEADMLHPEAQRSLLKTQALIAARNARLAAARHALDAGQAVENDAERAAMTRDYAAAIRQLRGAEAYYAEVTDEFAAEFALARRLLSAIRPRMNELKLELINNARLLSGSGSSSDSRNLAQAVNSVDEQALKALLEHKFQEAAKRLADDFGDRIR